MSKKLDYEDGKKLWRHFSRYAEYDDLKDLYKKVMPEILKFEDRLFEFQSDREKYGEIIKRFDERIAYKADKNAIE